MSPKNLTPRPPYFLIKVGKKEQQEKREKIGSLYVPQTYVFMKRELQFGEIVAIGSEAQEYMPMASVGDCVLHHHLVSGKKTDNGHNFYLVDEDEDFNYYVVNAFEIPGERAMAYAVAIGEEIIPTPDYIFLEVPKTDGVEDFDKLEVGANGLVVRGERKKTREEWVAIMQKNKKRCEELANVIPSSPMEEIRILQSPERKERHDFAVKEIKRLEAENIKISQLINKKKYEPYVVAAVNPEWSEQHRRMFGDAINPGDTVYMLNIACQLTMDFAGAEFIVSETKYFGVSEKWFKNSVYASKLHNPPAKKGTNKVRN